MFSVNSVNPLVNSASIKCSKAGRDSTEVKVLPSARLLFLPYYTKHGVSGGSDVCHTVVKVKVIETELHFMDSLYPEFTKGRSRLGKCVEPGLGPTECLPVSEKSLNVKRFE